MKPSSLLLAAAGTALLALAAWQIPSPRPTPRPNLPEIGPFSPGEPVAVVLPPAPFPFPPEELALVRRARAAGAAVQILSPETAPSPALPRRAYSIPSHPESPAGFHPDQWPSVPAAGNPQMLVLSPEETAAKTAAVLAAAQRVRDSRADPRGLLELPILSLARRAEIYLPVPQPPSP